MDKYVISQIVVLKDYPHSHMFDTIINGLLSVSSILIESLKMSLHMLANTVE